ncbi:HEPN domain-containing protein [Candidatus Woesearchaeota archaeon]|nr:HEPN domain-containing protein [Candidatus Woesearchaeota archaeon]
MRKEIQNWFDQSKDDFDGANYNFNGGKYYIAAFLCQQSVEKALKALFLYEKNGASVDLPSRIYDEENTKRLLVKSEEILQWIEKRILKK